MYLVVFRNRKRKDLDRFAYEADAVLMEELAAVQPGFLSFKTYIAADGEAVAISEWASEAAARAWRAMTEHVGVQIKGRAHYYDSYTVFACSDPRVHRFEREEV